MKRYLYYCVLFIVVSLFYSCTETETQESLIISGSPITKSEEDMPSFNYQFSDSYGAMCQYWNDNEGLIKEMKACEDGNEKLDMLQISKDLLSKMETVSLAELCYTFPLAYDIFASNDENTATEFYIGNFDGLKELSLREDGATCLLSLYNQVNNDGEHPDLRKKYLKRILQTKTFQSRLTDKQKKQLNQSFQYNPNVGAVTEMLESDVAVTFYTRFHQSVTAYIINDEFNPSQIDSLNDYVVDTYHVTLVGDASKKYNCHAYAWLNNAGQSYWLDSYDVTKYFTNDLYTSCTANRAERIYYYCGDHSALPYDSSHYISKWGNLGLCIHTPTNVPAIYYPSYRSYYRDDVEISGPDYYVPGNTYVYTVTPYMSYATYEWYIDQPDNRYEIISINNNVLTVKLLNNNLIYDVYCNVKSSSGYVAKQLMFETLYQ